jgi:PTH2 family peptidyl-tRNA hydrolase
VSAIKQVLLYRRDLKMRKGKIAAQCAHASLKVLLDQATDDGDDRITIQMDPSMAAWVRGSFTKIVLSVESEAELLAAHAAAIALGLPTSLITDSGRTEFGGVPTRTTVAIGPAPSEEIDPITGRDGLVGTKLA